MTAFALCIACHTASAQPNVADWHLVYSHSHRATYTKEWKYHFPHLHSKRWTVALRYPPTLAWSKNVTGKAELLTSDGWKPFKEVTEGSLEKRPMLFIDYEHDDPKLKSDLVIRTSLTASIYNQQLKKGKPATPAAPLTNDEQAAFLAETETFDFSQPNVKAWMDRHKMWLGQGEKTMNFVHRVYKELRNPRTLPYNTKDGGRWVCSQILKVGYGECCRHAIVGTSILRANKIPARTVCGLWAIDNKSSGGHCWGEFFLEGVGWVPYDTTLDGKNSETDEHFGAKKGEILAGMVDFDWVIDARPEGKQTVFAIDAFPGFWSQGTGNTDHLKLEENESVRILKGQR